MTQPTTNDNSGVSSRIRRAYFWSVIGSTSRYVAGFAISIVLARLLKPEDYGLIGIVTVFVELLLVFYESGLGNAVIHFQEDDPARERPTYFTAALIAGCSFTAILYFTAPLVGDFYHEPRLVPLLRVMSFALSLGSIKTISGGILTRDLRFRALSAADVFASLTGGIVAIILAYLGFGVWSLVVNVLLFVFLQMIAYGWWVRPVFRWPLDREILRRLWSYGAPTTGSGLLYKFYDNADYLVVGKLLGPTPLGFYTLAFRLAMLINDRISAVVNRVAFPSFARLKDEPQKAIEHWFAVTHRVTLITFPLLVWLGVSAEDFVRVVLGAKWLPAVLPLRYLCVMTAVKILTNVVGQMLTAVGYPAVVFRFDVLTAIVLPIAFLIGCKQGGLVGMGIAWCTIFPLLRIIFLLGAKRVVRFSVRDYFLNLSNSIWVSALCAGGMLAASWISPASGFQRLILRSLFWAAALVITPILSRDVRRVILEMLPRRWGPSMER